MLICKPADPEAKGLVERFQDYLERSFLPGRDFASPADLTPNCTGLVALRSLADGVHRADLVVVGLAVGQTGIGTGEHSTEAAAAAGGQQALSAWAGAAVCLYHPDAALDWVLATGLVTGAPGYRWAPRG